MEVQKKIAEKKKTWRPRAKNKEYLLTGLLVCFKCNHKYNGVSSISNHRTNKKKRWYRCSGPHLSHIKCKNRAVKAEDIEPEITKIVARLAQNDRLKQCQWMAGISKKSANFSIFDKNTKTNPDEVKSKIEINHKKQLKLTDAYLGNLFGEEVFRDKIDDLRKEEEDLKKLLAGIELRRIERERSERYTNRVKDFLEGYDDDKEKVDFATKKELSGLLFKNIKIAPPAGGARLHKRISFSLFEPFNLLLSEVKEKPKCRKNKALTKIVPKKSTSEPSAVR